MEFYLSYPIFLLKAEPKRRAVCWGIKTETGRQGKLNQVCVGELTPLQASRTWLLPGHREPCEVGKRDLHPLAPTLFGSRDAARGADFLALPGLCMSQDGTGVQQRDSRDVPVEVKD